MAKLVLATFLSFLALEAAAQRRLFSSPRAVVSEYYGSPYFENLRPIHTLPNSDLIVGENTSKGIKKLLFECKAAYPVQWIYQGDGVPEMTSDTNTKRQQSPDDRGGVAEFGATLAIGKLTEAHSGNYTCRGVQNKEDFVSYYLYVPGPEMFTSVGGDKVTYSYRDAEVRIPCSVSHPNVHVTLQKVSNGYVSCPVNESISFSPKTGFTMRVYDMYEPSGSYVCTGSMNNQYKVIQFDLIEHFDAGASHQGCSLGRSVGPRCGINAECRLTYKSHGICVCRKDFVGDPYSECRRNDYPSVLPSADPCHPTPCGKYGDCFVRNGLAVCSCQEGYHGKPPHCQLVERQTCIVSQNCPSSHPVCVSRKCINPCTETRNYCGRNSDCRLVNRTPVCSCPQGFAGDPHRECVRQAFLPNRPPPLEELVEERLRPECQLDEECPLTHACVHQRCQNPCPSMCGHLLGAENCLVQNHKAYCNGLSLGRCHPSDTDCRLQLSSGGQQQPPFNNVGGCHRKQCGPNSECRDVNGEGICSCLPGYTGSPPGCSPVCYGNSGCSDAQVCVARRCQDACEDVSCGYNAKCYSTKHKAECQCLSGYYGDPKSRCTLVPGSLLEPICNRRCGAGAKCVFVNNTAACKCLDPFDRNCRVFEDDRCFSDDNCPRFMGCFNGACKNPCDVFRHLCGENQECRAVNHKAECGCKPGYPFRINNDCYKTYNTDKDRSSLGPLEVVLPQVPVLQPGDDDGALCEPPFCQRGDRRLETFSCRYNADCPSTRMCVEGRCADMCSNRLCGGNAECIILDRRPQCRCAPGFIGSPAVMCFPMYPGYRYLNEGNSTSESADGNDGKTIILLTPEESTQPTQRTTAVVSGHSGSSTKATTPMPMPAKNTTKA